MEKIIHIVRTDEAPQDVTYWKPNRIPNVLPPLNRFDKNTSPGNMIISPDFKEFIELLNTHNVQYLVVEGYAVAFHGYPRYTKDLDIWIHRTSPNAKKLLQVLDDFGFGALAISADDFLRPESTIQLGYPPNRIDLLTSLKGMDFDTCYACKEDEKKPISKIREGAHTPEQIITGHIVTRHHVNKNPPFT
jgi:hypothetical protein